MADTLDAAVAAIAGITEEADDGSTERADAEANQQKDGDGAGDREAADGQADKGNGRSRGEDEGRDGSSEAQGEQDRDGAGGAEAAVEADDAGDWRKEVVKGKTTVKELSKLSGIDIDTLYGIMVPSSDGSGHHMSLEDMKAQAGSLDDARLEIEQSRSRFEVEQRETDQRNIRSKQELQIVTQLLANSFPPEALAKARDLTQAVLQQEQAMLREVRPEWNDANTYGKWLEGAKGLLKEAGFRAGEVEAMGDHRQYLAVDLWMKDRAELERYRNLTKGDRKAPPKAPKSSGAKPRRGNQAVQRAKQTGRQSDQIDATVELIGGSGRR